MGAGPLELVGITVVTANHRNIMLAIVTLEPNVAFTCAFFAVVGSTIFAAHLLVLAVLAVKASLAFARPGLRRGGLALQLVFESSCCSAHPVATAHPFPSAEHHVTVCSSKAGLALADFLCLACVEDAIAASNVARCSVTSRSSGKSA